MPSRHAISERFHSHFSCIHVDFARRGAISLWLHHLKHFVLHPQQTHLKSFYHHLELHCLAASQDASNPATARQPYAGKLATAAQQRAEGMEDNLLAPEPPLHGGGGVCQDAASHPSGHSQGLAQRLQTLREENGLGAAHAAQPSTRLVGARSTSPQATVNLNVDISSSVPMCTILVRSSLRHALEKHCTNVSPD